MHFKACANQALVNGFNGVDTLLPILCGSFRQKSKWTTTPVHLHRNLKSAPWESPGKTKKQADTCRRNAPQADLSSAGRLGYFPQPQRNGFVNLISKYTLKRYKCHKTTVNNSDVSNILDKEFNRIKSLDVLVSDLTYVRVGERWNYICTIIDLYNREIIGYSCGKTKSANLVIKAFNSINRPLDKVNIFNTDRGSEFKIRLLTI